MKIFQIIKNGKKYYEKCEIVTKYFAHKRLKLLIRDEPAF